MTDNTRPRWISTFESCEIRNPKNGCNLSQVDTLHSRLLLKFLQLTDGGAKAVPKWYQSWILYNNMDYYNIFSSFVSRPVSISPVRPQRPQANPQPTGTQWWAKDMTSEHVRNTRYIKVYVGIWNSWAVVIFCISMYFDHFPSFFELWSLALLWGHHMKAPNSFPLGGRADAGAARLEARDRMET